MKLSLVEFEEGGFGLFDYDVTTLFISTNPDVKDPTKYVYYDKLFIDKEKPTQDELLDFLFTYLHTKLPSYYHNFSKECPVTGVAIDPQIIWTSSSRKGLLNMCPRCNFYNENPDIDINISQIQ